MNGTILGLIKEQCSLYEYKIISVGNKYLCYEDTQCDNQKIVTTISGFFEGIILDTYERMITHNDSDIIDNHLEDICNLSKAIKSLGIEPKIYVC